MRIIFSLAIMFCAASIALAQTREELVRGDKAKVEEAGFWIYNDLPKAFAEAKRTGKPIVVVLRCLPCHECVKLDDELVDTHPVIRPLLEKFVCVRQVATNGLDLNLFQYDTDQSFAVFFFNADKTIYGRYGTRSHRTEWLDDVSLTGLAKALQGALDLHKNYDQVKPTLAAKTGAPLEFASPELYPSLKDKYTNKLNYEGDVVKSCIHCHQIGDARRDFYWQAKKPIPETLVWPYPHPKAVGLIMAPDEKATVKDVAPGSPAAEAGFKNGDVIESLQGQPLLSIADIQWVLHHTDPNGDKLAARVRRAGATGTLTLSLPKDWRHAGDLSWRVSTWGLRRMAAGGLVLETMPDAERNKLDVPADSMALLVKRAGKYGPHATARRTGIREGDVLVEFDGQDKAASEQELLTRIVTTRKPGDKVPVKVRRGRQTLTFQLPIQQ